MGCYYLIFKSSTQVMRADSLLEGSGLRYEIVPVPKAISSECGLCVRLYGSLDAALEALHGLKPVAVYDEKFRCIL